MSELRCDICDNKVVGHPNGIFKCVLCGTEYDTAWAKSKLQVFLECPEDANVILKNEKDTTFISSKEYNCLKRGWLALEDCVWDEAKHYFDQALNANAESAEAYLGLLLASLCIQKIEGLSAENPSYETNRYYKNAIRFADETLRIELVHQLEIAKKNESIRKENLRLLRKKDSKKKNAYLLPLRERAANASRFIVAGYDYTVGLKSDGTVVAIGENGYGVCDVSGWNEVIRIHANGCTVGLKADGTIFATGYEPDVLYSDLEWVNIKTVVTGSGHIIGLKSDGTVVALGYNEYGQCDVSGWTDVVQIAAGPHHTIGLKSNGDVVACGNNEDGQCNVSAWDNIGAIVASSRHTVGLRKDGTAIAVGDNSDGQCDVSSWEDLVAIAAGACHTIGLKMDGTVVSAGQFFGAPRCDVSGWRNIIAIATGLGHTVGLKDDGTVVACGSDYDGQCDVDDWDGIVAIDAGDSHTIGLRFDGTVVACGENDNEQCEVSDWKLFDATEECAVSFF